MGIRPAVGPKMASVPPEVGYPGSRAAARDGGKGERLGAMSRKGRNRYFCLFFFFFVTPPPPPPGETD